MSTTTPSPLLSDSLRGLGLDAGTLFFGLNYEFTKVEQTGLFKKLKKRLKLTLNKKATPSHDANPNQAVSANNSPPIRIILETPMVMITIEV